MKRNLVLLLVFSSFASLNAQWNLAYTTPGQGFEKFYFTDTLHGIFAHLGPNKSIRTTDGGITFTVDVVPAGNYNIYTSYMENLLVNWIAGSGVSVGPGKILRTTDGGVEWLNMTHPAPPSSWSTIIKVRGSSVWFGGGYRVTSTVWRGLIMRTPNGGESWEVTQYPQFGVVAGIVPLDSMNIVIHGTEGLLAHSADGGLNWSPMNLDTNYQVDGVRFANQSEGYAIATNFGLYPGDAYLYATTDGGFTWNIRFSWLGQGWKPGLSVIPGTSTVFVSGWLSGTGPPYIFGILKSTNAGVSWDTVATTPDIPTYLVTPDERHGWAAVGPYIYRYNYVPLPMVEAIPDTAILVDSVWTYQVRATGMGLRYRIAAGPAWLSVDYLTGLMVGTPLIVSSQQVTVEVRDTVAQFAATSFQLSVIPPVPRIPIPLEPLKGVSGVSTSLTLKWRSVRYATMYQVQLATDSSFTVPSAIILVDTLIPDTTVRILNLENATRYYWHVRASNTSGTSEWSEIFYFTTTTMDVRELPGLPTEYTLHQNYPNPFNHTTVIRYTIPRSADVRLAVFNLLGQEVAVLVSAHQTAGIYEANFNASHLPSGIYFYRLTAGTYTNTKKILLVK